MLFGELTDANLPEGPAPVFRNLLGTWVADPDAAARYAEPLSAPGARVESLWWNPDPDEPHRIGLLTDRAFLSEYPSISGRGAWLSKHAICFNVPSPPIGLDMALPPDQPGLTRRQELANEIAEPVCAGCHRVMDPPGFSLEHFDELGEYRTVDDGHPVDASGEITLTNNMVYSEVLRFSDVEDLAQQLVSSCSVNRCVAQQVWFDAVARTRGEYLASQAGSEREIDLVFLKFADDAYSLETLIQAVVTSPSFAGTQ